MIIVEHRKNQSSELKLVPPRHGVEIDLRLFDGELILAHDPFKPGETFEKWSHDFHHSLLILNVKEEGLEDVVLGFLEQKNVNNYFFLDQSLPSVIKSIKLGHSSAARISEFENFTWTPNFSPDWIWVDCFSGNWDYLDQALEKVSRLNIKTCIVSPELQGRYDPGELINLKSILSNHKFVPDAVCTKESSKWES